MKSPIRFALAGLLSLVMFGSAKADLLNLNPVNPDIYSESISVSYDGTTLSAVGDASLITMPNGDVLFVTADSAGNGFGTYMLSADINSAGVLSGGTIEIDGYVPDLNLADTGTLLTGTLTAFGFNESDPANSPLHFLFSVTGGDLADEYGGIGAIGGIIVGSPGLPATGFADGAFTGATDAQSDVFAQAVPEPATLAIGLLAGGMGVLSRRSRRRGTA